MFLNHGAKIRFLAIGVIADFIRRRSRSTRPLEEFTDDRIVCSTELLREFGFRQDMPDRSGHVLPGLHVGVIGVNERTVEIEDGCRHACNDSKE